MSKYKGNTESDRATEQTAAMGAIYMANEQAEANRIARAYLEFKLIMAIDPSQLSTFTFDAKKDLA